MAVFHVQIAPFKSWDKRPFQIVEAPTAKDAAEQAYGKPLRDTGSEEEVRARVFLMIEGERDTGKLFYDG